MKISIHAPREGGDRSCRGHYLHYSFQSTPPARGATTRYPILFPAAVYISIHAPREGGDRYPILFPAAVYISIHAPREGGDSKDAQFYLRIFDK